MGKFDGSFNLKEAKKQIAEKTKDFEKRITTAKNDFERLLVYRDMVKIINEEVFAIGNVIEKLINSSDLQVKETLLELEKNRSGLTDLLDLIRKEIHAVFENAYIIQEAMIRSFTLKERIFSGDINDLENGLFKIQ